MVQNACFFSQSGKKGSLESPFFSFALNFMSDVRATAWTNHRTGKSLAVSDGAEVVVEVDTALQRIPITGWRANLSGIIAVSAPDDETGYKQGFHRPEFNDSAWTGCMNPTELAFSGETLRAMDPDQCLWARTHVFIPESLKGDELSIVLGGVGLMDFRFMRVFLNGRMIGVRREKNRWHEPGKFKIAPNSKNHSFIRFGLDNVIAIQLADTLSRTPELDQLDPEYGRALALTCCWPAQFEQFIVAGKALQKLNLRPSKVQAMKQGKTARVQVELQSAKPKVAVTLTYEWDSKDPVLNKRIEIRNEDKSAIRIMNIGLGSFSTKAKVTDGEQGFPVYIDKEFFATLAHPAGWAMGQKGQVELWQYPGKILAPGETMQSMSAMLGVGERNAARKEFVHQVEKRMRRVVRRHDKPYAIFEPYGCWPIPHGEIISVEESDDILLPNIKRVAEGQRNSGCKFDIYSIDFWLDAAGDFERPDPKRFPDGFKNVLAELRKAGIAPGLWLTASQGGWANGKNPALSHCDTSDQAYRGGGGTISRDALNICRAEEPARSMFINGLGKQIRENGVRMIKFDGFWPICYNPHHGHLPGIYSTEAFFDAAIEFFQAMDAASPDVFLILYWGHRSPWWLLYADTVFECGLLIEASTPSTYPSLYARDGVTQLLDMGQWYCADLPTLGKESLGVWLSDWPWNSIIGKERWQEGFIMDICRGSMLAQPWSDEKWLTPAERKEMALFIDLLKAQPNCFRNSKRIYGNPWKNEPYGYCCSNGNRAFLAINNASWEDAVLPLELNAKWGLPEGEWEIARWYPNPARLKFDGKPTIALRPYEAVLLEAYPKGEKPTLARRLSVAEPVTGFEEGTIEVSVKVAESEQIAPLALLGEEKKGKKSDAKSAPVSAAAVKETDPKRVLVIKGTIPAAAHGGKLVITLERLRKGHLFQTRYLPKETALEIAINGKSRKAAAVLGEYTFPSAWQVWKTSVPAQKAPQDFEAHMTVKAPKDIDCRVRVRWLPE